jgi:hypothetical protein
MEITSMIIRIRFKHISYVVLGSGVIISVLLWYYLEETRFYRKYTRIHLGMTIKDVEGILGKGQNHQKEDVPVGRFPGGTIVPVVVGERFINWEYKFKTIWVGMRNGEVVSKWYWEPSL